jgi:hypothetical protein
MSLSIGSYRVWVYPVGCVDLSLSESRPVDALGEDGSMLLCPDSTPHRKDHLTLPIVYAIGHREVCCCNGGWPAMHEIAFPFIAYLQNNTESQR